jgi:hypothetical protein
VLDAETALEIKTVTFVSDTGRLAPRDRAQRLPVGRGVMVPFRVRDFVDGKLISELVVAQVELDARIDERSFRMER